tara:strand:+ start:2821 stop:4152 length:1332 start_codon:yes stop_codon:yes gene_type:complete
MTLRLLLVRHGLSSFNKVLKIQGRNDLSTLSEEGKIQAIETGKTLADIPIDYVYSSPLQRASETTKNILEHSHKGLKPIYTNGLLEIDLGEWSGLTKNEVKLKFPDAYLSWRQDPKKLSIKRKDGNFFNPIEELTNQTKDFLKDLLIKHSPNQNQTILLVGHNAILRCILLNLIGDPSIGFRRLQIDNASISIININSAKNQSYDVQIECLNSTTHLTPIIPLKEGNSRLILVRHGETNWNREGRFQGQIDIPLNATGKEQAFAAGLFLKNFSIQKAFSSSMSRPKETAEIILQHHDNLKINLQENLVEIGHGEWEGKLETEIKKDWPQLLTNWKERPETVEMPSGENINKVWERSINCWVKISRGLNQGETALVVAHDAVNKTILCNLLGLQPKDIWMIKQGNGGINVIDIPREPSEMSVITSLNITSHLGGVLDKTAAGAL